MPRSQKRTDKKKPRRKNTGLKKTVRKKATRRKAKTATPKKASPAKKPAKKWSGKVTATSNAMDLEEGIFKSKDPAEIARSVKKSAEKSRRKKAGPFQSAMSMINFYENRGGKNISSTQKKVLDNAKDELRNLFGREEP
jgi:hypothetical protein